MKQISLSKEMKQDLQSLLNKHKTYDLFSISNHSYDYADILNEIVTYCAYCNIENIKTKKYPNGRKYERMEFDHFIPKNGTKEVDLNCENLVPSCHTCNHKKSNSDSSQLVNPFNEDFDSLSKFGLDITPQGLDDYTKANIILEVVTDNRELAQKVKNSIAIFNLETRYNAIKEEFKEFYINLESYPDIRKRDIETLIPLEVNVLNYMKGLENNNINHTKCGKFKKDLIERYANNMMT